MTIHIEDLKFQCIIGILDFERVTPQDVIVQCIIEYEYTNDFINYADVVKTIKSDLLKNKYLLIEDALSKLSKKLKANFSLINTLSLRIAKPSVLPDCMVSVSDNYNFNS